MILSRKLELKNNFGSLDINKRESTIKREREREHPAFRDH